jgi:hypothetical protein
MGRPGQNQLLGRRNERSETSCSSLSGGLKSGYGPSDLAAVAVNSTCPMSAFIKHVDYFHWPVTRPRKCREPLFDRRARRGPGGTDQRVVAVWDRPYGKRTLAITLEQLRSYACAATVAGRVN